MTTVVEWDWNDVEQAVESLALSVQGRWIKPDLIVCFSRGGMVPAALLEDMLGLFSDIYSIPVTHYKVGQIGKHEHVLVGALPTEFGQLIKDKTVLLVDDLIDSGDTMKHMLPFFKSAKLLLIAVLAQKSQFDEQAESVKVYNEPNRIIVVSAQGVRPNDWVCFPWERNEFKGLK